MPVTAWSTYVGCVVGSAKIPGSNLNQALTCREDANSSTTLANHQFHQVIVKLWKVQHKLEPQTTRFQSKSCAFWNVLVAAERHKFLLWKQIFSDSGVCRQVGSFHENHRRPRQSANDQSNHKEVFVATTSLQQPPATGRHPVGKCMFFLSSQSLTERHQLFSRPVWPRPQQHQTFSFVFLNVPKLFPPK